MTNGDTSFLAKLKKIFIGGARDIRDPRIFHKLSLVALFAWVGLGADGLSSSCYGPEEAFLALKGHIFLGIFVALAAVFTIFIITASYSQIVELFPSGGGGYLVASKLLSPSLGMVSGCALLIDYVLTIALSISSGTDAIFSFLPPGLLFLKLPFALAGVMALMVLNLRGVKEAILPLMPIFLAFIATHAFAIIYAVITHISGAGDIVHATVMDAHQTYVELGWAGMLFLIMKAYSMGAGTYTGIEAVSNGMPILREPKVKTAKTTMLYMAASLAFMAFGLMLGYILYRVSHIPGKTLNAVLFETMSANWGANASNIFVLVTLFSEAVLLFVAAQTGFLGGPRVISNMAADRWFPFQFALLSERFVIKNGIMIMGLSAFVIVLLTKGSVKLLVILYSINVFITFCLSQLGMVRHWIRHRAEEKLWKKKLAVNGIGLALTSFILVSIIIVKFNSGGWITILVTGSLIATAVFIKKYYFRTQRLLKRLDKLVSVAETSAPTPQEAADTEFDKNSKTAVILVTGFNGMGFHTLFNVVRLFGENFKNYIFIQTGILDAGNFKGIDGVKELENKIKGDLGRYSAFMRGQGYFVKTYSAVGTDVVDETLDIAEKIYKTYPKSIFFGGQIVFNDETFLDQMLYNHATFAVQRRLHQQGIPFLIMPVKVG